MASTEHNLQYGQLLYFRYADRNNVRRGHGQLFESELEKEKNCRGWQRNQAEMSRREYPDWKERLSW